MSKPTPTRYKIERLLLDGPATVSAIAVSVGTARKYAYTALCLMEKAGRLTRDRDVVQDATYAAYCHMGATKHERPLIADEWRLTAAALADPLRPPPKPTVVPPPPPPTTQKQLLRTREHMGPLFNAFFAPPNQGGTASPRRSVQAHGAAVGADSHGGGVRV